MIDVARQILNRLWWMPGSAMDLGWWDYLGLDAWREPYAKHPTLRPSVDLLLRKRLKHGGLAPELSSTAGALLGEDSRGVRLIVTLGLWRLGSPDYVVLNRYRSILAGHLGESFLELLPVILPLDSTKGAEFEPDVLLEEVCARGLAWLSYSQDQALALSVLRYPPLEVLPHEESVDLALSRLMRWL